MDTIKKTCQNCADYGGCYYIQKKEPTQVCKDWKLDFKSWEEMTKGMDINEIDKLSRKKW